MLTTILLFVLTYVVGMLSAFAIMLWTDRVELARHLADLRDEHE